MSNRSARVRTPYRRPAAVALSIMVVVSVVAAAAVAAPLGGAATRTLAREPQLTPAQIGDGSTNGLQFPNPSEGLALVAPPDAASDGGAHLSYPLVIPKGRGIQPNVTLKYDSGGGNGWLGQGWDLSMGEISVDTRWGAPYFDPNKESETYLFDGSMLIPNALGPSWEPRLPGHRQDYTRQVETQYQQIIRHEVPGEGTKGYFWEVHDKGGNVYWYGGKPDAGGPEGYGYLGATEEVPNAPAPPQIDRSAIVTDEHGNGVRWMLSAMRDVGVNQISYHYSTVHYAYGAGGWSKQETCTPSGNVLCGKHTYLSRITYTEGANRAPAPDGDAEYEVSFLRESDVNPGSAVRADPVVSAIGGFVDVIIDRLARVEVRHGSYTVTAEEDEDSFQVRSPRSYDELSVRYDLGYQTGPFGKSLLKTVTQVGSDATTSASHTFKYNDRVSTGADSYNGFGPSADWNTGDDLPDRLMLDDEASIGALGSSESNSGEGHAYVGFNPVLPLKVGSFGASLQIGGGATEAIAEWLDINGDGLPDKIYRDSDGVDGDTNDINRDGPIRYRLNRGGPNGSATFGEEETVTGITKLSKEGHVELELAGMAFPVVTVALGVGTGVSWGDAYFSDANFDGLPDYVSGGDVWFNHLDASGKPVFEQGSDNTLVPVADASASVAPPPELQELQDKIAAQNPLVDTVRRWTAPFEGTIAIDAPVTLNPASGASVDGVRVATEHDGTQLQAANLLATGHQAFTAPTTRAVKAGDDIYFRVGSVSNGANDDVDWNPRISYTAIKDVADVNTVPTDVNGLSQTSTVAGDDFVLSGRPDTLIFVPFKGKVRFSATIEKTKKTTDDVHVRLQHNGTTVPVAGGSFPASFIGAREVSAEFDVAAPVQPTSAEQVASQDSVTVKLATDTPIDLHAIDWNPKIAYTSAFDKDGKPKDLSKGISFQMTPEIEQYAERSSTTVSLPWRTGSALTRDARVSFTRPGDSPATTAVVAVKTRNGVVTRQEVNVPAGGGAGFVADLNVALQPDTDYWFDVTIRDKAPRGALSLTGFSLTNGVVTEDIAVPGTLHWTGQQSIFPLAYRGWAVAGYNGDGARATQAIQEGDFTIDTASLPKDVENVDVPETYNDPNYNPPVPVKSFAYLPVVQLESLPGQPAPLPESWVGRRANHAASADKARSSRLGTDSVDLGAASSGGSGRAVTRVGVAAPSASLAFGLGPLTASFGFARTVGLVDYTDLNGDGYPDIVTPNSVTYTTPRGGYEANSRNPGGLAEANQDLTFAVSGGFSAGLVDIKPNAKGKTNATQGGGAGKGSDANDSGGGAGIGVSVNASWTSPNASGPSDAPTVDGVSNDPTETYQDQIDKSQELEGIPGSTAPIQLGLADVNGDGLADRVYTNPAGVFARYNLGYRFADAPVQLSNGGFESQESYAGGLSLGFSLPWGDFSGGASLNWNIDLSRYSWVDVNGDGILDQIHKIDNSHPPTVRFGTGTGMLPPVTYGEMASAQITDQISAGQQASLDRSTGVGGQFDFTVGIGPLCLPLPLCYIIINPGASYQNSISSTEVDLQDVNGDGYADSVQTLDDNSLKVRENKQADTNLLASVENPLGGTISMTYERDGNTVDNPKSVWNMASVEVNDGRPGDGVDVRRTTYGYDGAKFDRLHRTSLGYAEITSTELDTRTTPAVGVRRTVREFLNGNVFEAGLETRSTVTDLSNNGYIKGVRQTWELRDVRQAGADFAEAHKVESFGFSFGPQLTQVVSEVGDGTPGGVAQSSTTNMTYDGLGNVIRQADLGEDDDPDDDVVADYIFTRCDTSSDIGCIGDLPTNRPSPIWDANLCSTWVSLPGVITVTNGKTGTDRIVYRNRDGRPALCDNASVTHLEEDLGNGEVAETELTYDPWGSYDRIVYPVGENGRRYAVQYVWDPDGHANIGQVTEYDLDPDTVTGADEEGNPTTTVDSFLGDGLTEADIYMEGLTESATFDPLTNKVASRVDANGSATTYTYDPLARLASITLPLATQPLVTFEYFVKPNDPHAVARHDDVFHPGDTIDTATFADGVGRVVQVQNDATLFNGGGQSPTVGMIVSGATFFDHLGRPAKQFQPTRGTVPLGTFEPNSPLADTRVTSTEYDLWDLPTKITEPGNRVTTIAHEYGQVAGSGPTLYRDTKTAPNGRKTVTFNDFRGVVRADEDIPVGAPLQRTLFRNDGMGQLLEVVDPTGFTTTHAYDRMGRRTSTSTPDGGLVEFGYDPDGQLTSKVTPNLRAKGEQIGYQYELHRLTNIDYPGTADDVTYAYGAMGAPDLGAGHLVRSEDGSRIQANAYDTRGNIAQQMTTMKLHNWTPEADQSEFTWTTRWDYDGLRRLRSMDYPDGEHLTYGYDAGGLINAISGEEEGHKKVLVGYDLDTGQPIYELAPETWQYDYMQDRQYDELLRRRLDVLGNGVSTELTFDPDTLRLAHQVSVSPNRNLGDLGPEYKEIQDLSYTYDLAGNPLTYRNDVPGPAPSRFSGPTSQTYTYDPYGRMTAGRGEWKQSKDSTRKYELDLTYDTRGNVTSKKQKDWIQNGKKQLIQFDTTYSFNRTYSQPAPHQATGVANSPYRYDANGNLTGILDRDGKPIRSITWDAKDRMRTVTDGPETTEYNYDDSGQRSIERGPSGETATVNPWVTVRNGTDIWKHVWAGNDRIGTQRDDGKFQEVKQYFLHKDLQGSTNIVSDITGNTFQHHEYFASGQVWVDEKSTVFRTPYQFGGGYVDEVRKINNFGARWYDQNRELFYSPDPVLVDNPMAMVGTPALRSAYAFAGSNPLAHIDPSGRQYDTAQILSLATTNYDQAAAALSSDPAMRARVAEEIETSLPKSLVRYSLDIQERELEQKRAEAMDEIGKPFVEISYGPLAVKLSPGLFKQFTVYEADAPAPGRPTSSAPLTSPRTPPPRPSTRAPKPLPTKPLPKIPGKGAAVSPNPKPVQTPPVRAVLRPMKALPPIPTASK